MCTSFYVGDIHYVCALNLNLLCGFEIEFDMLLLYYMFGNLAKFDIVHILFNKYAFVDNILLRLACGSSILGQLLKQLCAIWCPGRDEHFPCSNQFFML